MHSASVSPTETWTIVPARTVAVVVMVLTLIGAVSVHLTALPMVVALALSMLVLAGGAWQAWRLIRPRWQRLRATAASLSLDDGLSGDCPVVEARGSFVSPLFIGFSCRMQSSGRRLRVGLFRTQLEDEAYRRLAVLLRQGPGS